MEILRDSVWQFVGVLLAVLATAITVLIYRAQRTLRGLGFGVLSQRRVISIDSEVSSRIQITFDGTPVGEVHLLVMALKNTGNMPLSTDDFVLSPLVTFGEKSLLMDAKVFKQHPSNLGAEIAREDNKIRIQPLLLNPGEYFVVQALVSAESPSVLCNARVKGVTNLTPLTSISPKGARSAIGKAGYVGIVAFVIATHFLTDISYDFAKTIESAGVPFWVGNTASSVLFTVSALLFGFFVNRLYRRGVAGQQAVIDDA